MTFGSESEMIQHIFRQFLDIRVLQTNSAETKKSENEVNCKRGTDNDEYQMDGRTLDSNNFTLAK